MRRLHRYIIGIVLFTAGCASTGSLQKPKISSSYDKFNDHTTVTTNEAIVKNVGWSDLSNLSIDAKAFAVCPGDQQNCKPDEIMLHLISTSEGWTFLDYRTFIMLIDGERYDFGEPEHNGEPVYGSNVLEQFIIPIETETFRKMAFSENVEAKIGNTELNLSFERREVFRMLLNRLDR